MPTRRVRFVTLPFRLWLFIALLCVGGSAVFVSPASAAEPSRFTQGKYKSGQLKFVEGLPVVTADGTPEQIGEELGTLLKSPLTSLMNKKEDIAHGFGMNAAPNILVKTSRLAVPAFPESQRREIEAMAKASGAESRYPGLRQHRV